MTKHLREPREARLAIEEPKKYAQLRGRKRAPLQQLDHAIKSPGGFGGDRHTGVTADGGLNHVPIVNVGRPSGNGSEPASRPYAKPNRADVERQWLERVAGWRRSAAIRATLVSMQSSSSE